MAPNLNSAFWHDDFGFLIDRSHVPVGAIADVRTVREDGIADMLESTGRLPNLGGAPVASWLLPRLVDATHGGINLDDCEHLRNDGGGIHLQWAAFTRAIKPRAFFRVNCYSNRITTHGQCMPNTDPTELVSAFFAPLLEQPTALATFRVSVTDMDPPTAHGKPGRRYVFGWDGVKFLGSRER